MFKICRRTPDADLFLSKQLAFENKNNSVVLDCIICIYVQDD